MKEEVKDLWVEALRSGKYKQARKYLKINDTFCCLGVLCDISELSGWDEKGHYFYSDCDLPDEVMDWAEINTKSGTFLTDIFTDRASQNLPEEFSLIVANDKGKSFNEIADIIEKYWEIL